MGSKPVVKTRTLQTVAMGYFDGIYPSIIQGLRDFPCVLKAVLMANGVATVCLLYTSDAADE